MKEQGGRSSSKEVPEVMKVSEESKRLLKCQMLQLPEGGTHCKKLTSDKRTNQVRKK